MVKHKALLIGINYIGSSSALNGCINDVKNVRVYLGERFAKIQDVHLDVVNQEVVAQDDELVVATLTDDQVGRHRPTRQNILMAFEWLIEDTQPGDKRFLHYSGHGSQVFDVSGDEKDNKDETLVPVDYQQAGMIIDDDVRRLLVDPLPQGAQLHVILDGCHTESGLDCPFVYDCDHSLLCRSHKLVACVDCHYPETKCDVVSWSGCMDSQTSADAYIKGAFAGALTSTFLEILHDEAQDKSYGALMARLQDTLKQRKYTQRPQLASGKPLDVNDKFDLF